MRDARHNPWNAQKPSRLLRLCVVLGVLGVWSSEAPAPPPPPDDQEFNMAVPDRFAIAAPAPSVTLAPSEAQLPNPVFPAQRWSVFQNNKKGATATFAVSAPFVHAVDNSYKLDVSLALALAPGPGPGWQVVKNSDQTDYATGKNSASVTAATDKAGDKKFDLTVGARVTTFNNTGAGTYSVQVVGTLTAN